MESSKTLISNYPQTHPSLPERLSENMVKLASVQQHLPNRGVNLQRGLLRIALTFAAAAFTFAPRAFAQISGASPTSSVNSTSGPVSAIGSQNQWSWTESFDGSLNTVGDVMELDSSVGDTFGPHTFVGAGIPVYFVHATAISSTGTSTANSFTALGDFHALVRLSHYTGK